MLGLESRIKEALRATEGMRAGLVKEAVKVYFGAVAQGGAVSEVAWESARQKTEALLNDRVLGEEWLGAVGGQAQGEEERAESLSYYSLAPRLEIAAPGQFRELKGRSVAYVALLGALAGTLLLGMVLRVTLDMRELGMILGGALGAFAAVLVLCRDPKGVVMLGVKKLFRQAFGKAAVFDRQAHEQAVAQACGQWLHEAVVLLGCLRYFRQRQGEKPLFPEEVLQQVGKHFYALHGCSSEELPIAVAELLADARNQGFGGLEGEPVSLGAAAGEAEKAQWAPELAEQYDTFGHIEAGDAVVVERRPVVWQGKVQQRGLVRRVRK